MGTRDRTRPDTSKRPGYITAAGYRRLEEEASYLWNDKRPRVARALADAAAEGDRSENAEYIYRKKQLGEIDRRLRFLGKRLDVLTIVSEKPRDDGRVYFGCWVTVEDEDGDERRYRIVGPDEWDVERGEISMDSPVGRALLGKRLDDEVKVRLPRVDTWLTITDISVDP
ncbi:MAG: transcription elongation factor GreB [Deltaproteobacteria bacterium]|jgi:transcription elongation factor GreB|nr:transcription elongation factor GreB [Deltaproteobacteria bacterium]